MQNKNRVGPHTSKELLSLVFSLRNIFIDTVWHRFSKENKYNRDKLGGGKVSIHGSMFKLGPESWG